MARHLVHLFGQAMATIADRALQISVDTYLKTVRAAAQAEVAKAVREAVARGKIEGHETVDAAVGLSCEKIGLNVTIFNPELDDGSIAAAFVDALSKGAAVVNSAVVCSWHETEVRSLSIIRPLNGTKRTSGASAHLSAFDPERTWPC